MYRCIFVVHMTLSLTFVANDQVVSSVFLFPTSSMESCFDSLILLDKTKDIRQRFHPHIHLIVPLYNLVLSVGTPSTGMNLRQPYLVTLVILQIHRVS